MKKEKEDRSRLPDPPKTAQEIWQQSVIGDYMARFKVGGNLGRRLVKCFQRWNLRCASVCRVTDQKPRKQWKQRGATWRKKRR